MGAYIITREHIKRFVVKNAGINKPYDREWNCFITIGYDYNETGKTIEEAYNKMTDRIYGSTHIMVQLKDNESLKQIVKNKL